MAQKSKKRYKRSQYNFKTKMATVSQNFPRTYYNLAKTWDAKVGSMSFDQVSFKDNKTIKDRIARLLHAEFKTQANGPAGIVQVFAHIGDLMSKHFNMDNVSMYDNSIWIYNMRASDTLPKSPNDLKRLYQFVRIAISQWFNAGNEIFLADDKNIHITVSFFLWYITKPHFFFKDKVTRQTTRYGIERIWTPLLLAKEVKMQPPNLPSAKPKTLIKTTNAQLPKWEQLVADIKLKISNITGRTFSWEDSFTLHGEISAALSDNDLNTNQIKKLQKLYSEYQVLYQKISKAKGKIMEAEMQNAKIVRSETNPSAAACVGCEQNQPNQLAHIGGCLEDPEEVEVPDDWEEGEFVGEKTVCMRVLANKSAEEEVPENWEDEW